MVNVQVSVHQAAAPAAVKGAGGALGSWMKKMGPAFQEKLQQRRG
mgnify:CR=1 FL=1